MWNAWPFCDSPFKLQLKWIKYIYLPHPVNLPLEYYLADAINPSSAVFFCRLWNENAHPRNLLRSSFESQAAIKLAAVQRGSFHHPARLMKVTPMLHLKNRADTQNEVMTSLGLRWIATPPPPRSRSRKRRGRNDLCVYKAPGKACHYRQSSIVHLSSSI